jgi:flavin reductase (DIM6/NTAB) family NADH-FMN oxidoreductase RutF
VSHKVHGDCHFLRSGCRQGSIQEQKETRKTVLLHEPERQKKSYTTEQKFWIIEPKILYFGTPVALVSWLNEDGSTDLAPISSFWALGWILILGLLTETKTADDVARHRECVVNLPSPEMWQNVEKTDPLTGKNPVPKLKSEQFRFEPRKFAAAELTPVASEVVGPARAKECSPVHMEARVHVAEDCILQDKYIYNLQHYVRLADQELGKTFRAEA